MKLSSDAANRIRQQIQEADERDATFLVFERSMWRLLWPFVLVVILYCNAQYAVDFMIRIADPEGPELFWGLNRSQLLNAVVAWILIISASVVMVILTDQKAQDIPAKLVKFFGWVVVLMLMSFSVWTAMSEMATKLQETASRGAVQNISNEAEQGIIQQLNDAQQSADQRVQAAAASVFSARQVAEQSRNDWARYQTEMKQRYAHNANDLAWVLNTTHSNGGGRPYVEAIARSDAQIVEAEKRLFEAQNVQIKAQQAAVEARQQQLQTVDKPSAEASTLRGFAEVLGITQNELFFIWSFIISLLLELVRYAGSMGTGRAIKDALEGFDKRRGKAGKAIKDQARAAAMAMQPNQTQPAFAMAGAGDATPDQSHAAPTSAIANQHQNNAVPLTKASPQGDFLNDQSVETHHKNNNTQDTLKTLQTQARHADAIADAISDAENGMLSNAAVHHLRDTYNVSIEGAEAIRDALIKNGHAIRNNSGRVDLL